MYAVIWKNFLLDRLADLYVAADTSERERMAAGVEAFNARLADDPLDVGESRVGGYRVAFPPLLKVVFHVDAAARRVRVTDVTRFGAESSGFRDDVAMEGPGEGVGGPTVREGLASPP